MFSCCFKRQNGDDDEYRRRPKTRNSLQASSETITHTAVPIPTRAPESNEPVKSLEEMQNECLEIHNEYRKKHGVSELILNKELNSYATEWATHLSNNNTLQYRQSNRYGENLYLGSGMGPQTHKLAVEAWYEEIKKYNFNKPGFSPNNGHFTQVIWKTSRELGVGVVTRDNRTWVVCNYNPPGNVMGNYMQCVPPLIEETVSKVIDKMQPQKKNKSTKFADDTDTLAPTHSRCDLSLWSKFELECLDSHNKYRAIHGSPSMKLNRILCNLAQDWSKQLAKRDTMSHRPKNEYGENIYYAMNFDPTAEHCVKSWYDEIKNYNFSNPGFSSQTGHFTQVVWKESIELGVGITKLNNKTFVVCNYSPAGNVMNEYKNQVPRPGDKPSTTNNFKGSNKAHKQQSFEEVCLDSHNNLRAIHGSPAMTINKNLNFFANDWAQHLAKHNKIEPRRNNRFGENIFYATNKEVTGHDPVEYWYSAIEDYNFNMPESSAATRNFTQVIWKSSKQLGVGVAKVGRSTYVVCNYDPRGNIAGKFAENVIAAGEASVLFNRRHQVPLKVDKFTAKILKCHNMYRAKHGCLPLELSEELMEYCSNYAEQLIDNTSFADIPKYVINSLTFQGDIPAANEIISNWYNEIKKYDFQKPEYNEDTRHFTQIVWKNTKFLGVGLSKRDQNSMLVLSYEPAGNIDEQFAENVAPPAT